MLTDGARGALRAGGGLDRGRSLPGGVCATVDPRRPPLPPGYDEPDWAAKIHVAVAPVYYHNYVLGHLFAAQLRHHLEGRVTGAPFFADEMAGRYLQEAVFGPGARYGWEATVLHATGERLNADYFVRSLC